MQIGELAIKMSADVAQLRTDMGEARRTVGDAMSDIRNAVGVAQRTLVALGGTATAAGFAAMIRSSIEAKAKLVDLALQAGTTVEAISALQEVGRFSDTGVEQIVGASNRLSKALVGVDDESKGAGQALRALGLDVEAFKRLSADQQLIAVAKAMETFDDGLERGQAAMLLFGKTGAELLPFLHDLAKTETLVAKETTEMAQRAKELEDNLVKLRSGGIEFARALSDELLPVLVEISRELTRIDDRGGESNVFAEGVRIALEAITVLGANVAFTLKGLGREVGAIAAQMAALARLDFEGFNAISQAVKEDGERALAELQAFEQRVLSARERSLAGPTTGDFARLDRIGRRPRLNIPGDGKDKVTEIQRIVAAIRERVAAEQLEADTSAELTAGQKVALDVMVKLRDAKLQASVADRQLVAGLLEQLLVQERANIAAKEERKAQEDRQRAAQRLVDEAARQAETIRALAKAEEDHVETIGLNQRELVELAIARDLDAAAALREKAATLALIPGSEQLVEAILDQSRAYDRLANARAKGLLREDAVRADSFAGARRGLEDYRREITDVNAAAYDLVRGTARNMEDEFTDAFGSIARTGNRLVDQLIADFYRLVVVRPLLNSLLGFFGGAITSGVGSLLSGTGGSPAISGPGLTVPPTFSVVPQAASRERPASNSGNTYISNTNISGNGVTRNELSAAMAMARDQAVAAVYQRQRREQLGV